MKRLVLTVLAALGLVACGERGELVFVQISDPQLGFMTRSEDHSQEVEIMEGIIAQVNELKPDFVVFSGDLVHWRTDTAALAAFDSLMGRMSSGIPVYFLPGNHDVGNDAAPEEVKAFVERYGSDRFVHKGKKYTVIGYNSCVVKAVTQDGQKEYEWLEQQLAQAGKNKQLVVVAHHPIYLNSPDEEETYENFPASLRSKYLRLFEKYGVDLYLAGHLHKCVKTEHNGIQLITCGAAGRQLGKDKHGYNVVSLKDGMLHVQYTDAF